MKVGDKKDEQMKEKGKEPCIRHQVKSWQHEKYNSEGMKAKWNIKEKYNRKIEKLRPKIS